MTTEHNDPPKEKMKFFDKGWMIEYAEDGTIVALTRMGRSRKETKALFWIQECQTHRLEWVLAELGWTAKSAIEEAQMSQLDSDDDCA